MKTLADVYCFDATPSNPGLKYIPHALINCHVSIPCSLVKRSLEGYMPGKTRLAAPPEELRLQVGHGEPSKSDRVKRRCAQEGFSGRWTLDGMRLVA
jgi:hypothetical protein